MPRKKRERESELFVKSKLCPERERERERERGRKEKRDI